MTHVQTLCLSSKQFTHFFILNYYYYKIPLYHSKNTILTMLNAGHSAYSIVSITDTHTSVISRHHFKSVLGFRSPLVIKLFQLFPSNTWYAINPITIWKAENTVWVT